MTKPYTINWKTNTIIMTKKFAAEASEYGTEAYHMLMDVRSKGFQITVKEPKPRKACPTRITFKQMEAFIKQCRDSESRIEVYERVKALSRVQRSPYKYVKEWFLTNYANYSENPEFDKEGFVIVKTKAQMEQEAEAAAAKASAAAPSSEQDNEASGNPIALLEAAESVQEAAA